MKKIICILVFIVPLYALPTYSPNNIGSHFYQVQGSDPAAHINLGTMVIISEIEMIIAERKLKLFFEEQPFKTIE